MSLQENLVQDTNHTEEGMTRRLTEYRENNTEDNTVTNIFEEDFELDVIKMTPEAIEDDKSYLHKAIVDRIKLNHMKQPRNYGLSPTEKAEQKRIELENQLVRERLQREERERLEAEEATERVRKQTEWVNKLFVFVTFRWEVLVII